MNQLLRITRTVFILLFLVTQLPSLEAQVVINEYSASNLNRFFDSFNKTEDWIELHNAGSANVNIGGWHLSDKASKPMKWAIPENTIIPAGGHLLFYCSGRDGEFNSEFHTNFKLSQTSGKDIILLADAAGNILEQYDMQLTLVEHARGRSTDGSPEWVVKVNPTPGNDNTDNEDYVGYTATPSMDLAAGYYEETQTVTITNNEPNSEIRYTLNGTNPTQSSSIYTGPLTVTSTTVIKAQAYSMNPDILPGKMDFNTYFINEDYSLAVFSVAANDVIDLANGEGDLIPIGSIEYFNTDKEREATSFGSLNRHGQDSWVLTHRSLDWVSRDEMGYSKAVHAPLFSYSDRDEYQKFMFRNSGDDNYPAIGGWANDGSTHVRDEYVQTLSQTGGLSLDVRGVERVVVFLNGEYWGVYGMRDRPVDHDYTDYYYDQGKYDIQYLSTWGTTEIEYGGQRALDEWVDLRDFILNNDMSVPENYKIAEDSINMVSMIDYMLVNLNVVASDWLNYNTGWWRGLNPDGDHKKWGFILWDLDATFDFYINYSNVPNTDPDAKPCDLESIAAFTDGWGEGIHGGLFLKLLDESPEFQQLYYGRYADLMNTVFNCENMVPVLDSMIATIRPEMPSQIARWGGSMNEWETNVTRLRDFVLERCELFDEGALECYDELSGPYEITLMVEPNIGIGEIDISTLDIESFPWTGSYFGGTETKIKARVFDEYDSLFQFSHWITSTGNVITPSEMDRRAEISITQSGTLTAVFEAMSDDLDGDGYSTDDCDDLDPNVNPGAVEICDGIDNNCDGQIDEDLPLFTYYADLDTDGYGDPDNSVQACMAPPGYTLNNTDCNDNDININEGVEEIPNNGIDDNCDGISEVVIIDNDNDGFPEEEDCNDNDPNINPNATEVCDGVDNNCDGQVDEGTTTTYYVDSDNDGYGNPEQSIESCGPLEGYVLDNTDCNDASANDNPEGEEVCDGFDNNCDGQIDEGFVFETYYLDGDLDGYGGGEGFSDCIQPFESTTIGGDCDDSDPTINPEAEEIPNNDIDENCDGILLIIDEDGDGWNSDLDCDDLDESINPGADDADVNGIDENCDGLDGPSSNENVSNNIFTFYPNPTSDKVFFNKLQQDLDYELISLEGRSVESGTLGSELDLINYPSGVYLLKVDARLTDEVVMVRIVRL